MTDRIMAIRSETWQAMREVLELEIRGARFTPEERAARAGLAVRSAPSNRTATIAVIPIYGLLSQRQNFFSVLFGGTSADEVRATLRRAGADPGVGTVILDVASPGGSVFGIEELAHEVAEVARVKPVVAVANSVAASAAYWAIAPAREILVAPSGEIGGIGIIAVHDDISRLQDRLGVKTTLITAGKFKAEATEFEPLTEEARAAIQGRVNDYYELFVNRVAAGRRTSPDRVRQGYAEGRVVGAREALRLKMVDRIGTLEDAINRFADQTPDRTGAVAARGDLDFRRRRQRHLGRVGSPR